MRSCLKHPKYKGKRIPKRKCIGCLELYLLLHNKLRLPTPPSTKIFKDKKTYIRKKKHKQYTCD